MDKKSGKRDMAKGAGKCPGIPAWRTMCVMLTLSMLPVAFNPVNARGAESWPGVDESVVEKFASERGREAHDPLINTDQGDLLLFVFLLAGTVGGFAAGYYWRMLLEGRKEVTARRKGKKG